MQALLDQALAETNVELLVCNLGRSGMDSDVSDRYAAMRCMLAIAFVVGHKTTHAKTSLLTCGFVGC